MLFSFRRPALWALVFMGVFSPFVGTFPFVSTVAQAGGAANRPSVQLQQQKVSVSQRRDVQEAIAAYKRAHGSPDKVRGTVQKAIAAGRHVTQALAPLVAQDVHNLASKYLDQLAAVAVKVAARSQPDSADVAARRQDVLGLLSVEQLSKEMIVERAEPAMVRLTELLRVDRNAVFAENKQLAVSRAALLELGAIWQACATAHAPQPPAGDKNQPAGFEALLSVEEDLILISPTTVDAAAAQVLAVNRAVANQVDFEEYRGVQILNGWRLLLGLNPLAHDVRLTRAARDHSHDMYDLKFFSHESPVEGKKTPGERAKRFDTTSHAENIHAGAKNAEGAMQGWFHSPGHFKNLFGKHARVGLGREQGLYTQMFGGTR